MIGAFVSNRLKSKFNQYSKVGVRSGMNGKEVAEAMLKHYNIHDVNIVQGKGVLTDHYNPRTKTIALSPPVYQGRHVSAAAVAAHECGHAIQHDTGYAMLQLRSSIAPLVKYAAWAQQALLIIALTAMPSLLFVVLLAYVVTTAFSFVTLPVEFDASERAKDWLEQSGVATGKEYDGVKDALWWAAMTYVAAALSALITLLFLLWASRRRR